MKKAQTPLPPPYNAWRPCSPPGTFAFEIDGLEVCYECYNGYYRSGPATSTNNLCKFIPAGGEGTNRPGELDWRCGGAGEGEGEGRGSWLAWQVDGRLCILCACVCVRVAWVDVDQLDGRPLNGAALAKRQSCQECQN